MNRWLVTLMIERRPRRGYPVMHRVTLDARWLIACLLLVGAAAVIETLSASPDPSADSLPDPAGGDFSAEVTQ